MKQLLAVSVLLVLSGCAHYRPSAQTPSDDVIQDETKFLLGIVELDDQGWFYDRRDVNKVLDHVKAEAEANGATIVVFVHGWHHSSREHDTNLECFKKVLERLHDQLQLPMFRDARAAFLPKAKNRVVGLYVGWRGRSAPGFLTYGTFWDRKAAALRVGHGDVPELFTRLQTIYGDYNKGDRFTALVTMGHSFGAQVVYAGIADTLKNRIAAEMDVEPKPGAPTDVIHGFGDLVVLVNPALEASVYQPIDLLTRERRYSEKQLPILLTVSSEADGPNRYLFPLGRALAVHAEPRGREGQYEQKTRTIGHYRPQITHCLALTAGDDCRGFARKLPAPNDCPPVGGAPPVISTESDSKCEKDIGLDVNRAVNQPPVWCARHARQPESIALAADIDFGETRFYSVVPIDRHAPFLVTKTTAPIVGGHSDMFNPRLVDFLVNYAAGANLKRFILWSRREAR